MEAEFEGWYPGWLPSFSAVRSRRAPGLFYDTLSQSFKFLFSSKAFSNTHSLKSDEYIFHFYFGGDLQPGSLHWAILPVPSGKGYGIAFPCLAHRTEASGSILLGQFWAQNGIIASNFSTQHLVTQVCWFSLFCIEFVCFVWVWSGGMQQSFSFEQLIPENVLASELLFCQRLDCSSC